MSILESSLTENLKLAEAYIYYLQTHVGALDAFRVPKVRHFKIYI